METAAPGCPGPQARALDVHGKSPVELRSTDGRGRLSPHLLRIVFEKLGEVEGDYPRDGIPSA